jgi:mannose-6-phosphate isomerase-like protein (cupin superfamily)
VGHEEHQASSVKITSWIAAAILLLLSPDCPARARSTRGAKIETLDKVVERTVRGNYEALHGCFRRVLAVDRKRGGTLFVKVTMGRGDSVKAAGAERDGLGHREAVRCVLGWVRGWTLHGAGAAGAGQGSEITIPLSFRPSPRQFAIHVEDVAEVPFGQGRVKVLLSERNAGAQRASLVQLRLDGKVRLPGRTGVDQGVLIVSGKGRLEHRARGKTRRVALRKGTAAWIPPRAAVTLGGELEALLLYSPGGIERSFVKKSSPPTGELPLRPVVAHLARVKPVAAGRAAKAWPLLTARRLRHRRLAVGLLSIEAGIRRVERPSASRAEVLYILEGRAEADLGGLRRSIRAGDAIYLPAGKSLVLKVEQKLTAWRILVPGPKGRLVEQSVGK